MLDTGILVAAVLADDAHHEQALAVLAQVDGRRWRSVHTTTLVLADCFNFIAGRVKDRRVAEALAALVFGSRSRDALATIHQVHGARFAAALDRYRREFDDGLSLTDWSTLVVMEEMGIDAIATFDRGFRGRVQVVDR